MAAPAFAGALHRLAAVAVNASRVVGVTIYLMSNAIEVPFEGGPWLSAFMVTVPMALRSKSNFRRFKSGSGSGGSGGAFERSVGLVVLAARPSAWQVGDAGLPLDQRPLVVSYIRGRSNVDVANYSKSILDACQGVLYVSDASVQSCMATGVRGTSTSFMLAFAQVAAGSGPEVLEKALFEIVRISSAIYSPL